MPAGGLREGAGVTLDRIRRQVGRCQRLEPGVAVRREHRERLAGLRDSTSSRSKMTWSLNVRKAMPRSASARATAASRIAGGGLVVVVRVDGVRRRARRRAAGSLGAACAWTTMSPPPRARSAASSSTSDSRMNSTRRSVRVGKRVEDLAVEDERAVDLARLAQRVVQRRVIEVAKVAAEPDQGAVDDLFAQRVAFEMRALPSRSFRRTRVRTVAKIAGAHLVAPQELAGRCRSSRASIGDRRRGR